MCSGEQFSFRFMFRAESIDVIMNVMPPTLFWNMIASVMLVPWWGQGYIVIVTLPWWELTQRSMPRSTAASRYSTN